MSGLFISFDSFLLKLPILFMFLFLTIKTFPISPGEKMNSMMKKIESEVFLSMPQENILMQKKNIFYLFLLIFSINFFSLFSHVFSMSALLTSTLVLSISFWVGVVLFKASFLFLLFLQGLTPTGTPIPLMSFMVIIELSSQMIRPITLMVRLAVNIMTGHLILSLMSFVGSVSFMSQTVFFLLELMVSLVQAYVFSLLLMLYLNE